MTQQEKINELLNKQDLLNLSYDYCRAVDRGDRGLMRTLWWPEARVDVGVFEGDALEYADVITAPNEALKRCSHAVSNPVFTIDGHRAKGQVYVNAATTSVVDGVESHGLVGGRYVDEYECRKGTWKFLFRAFVIDWAYTLKGEDVWASELVSIFSHQGQMNATDYGRKFLAG